MTNECVHPSGFLWRVQYLDAEGNVTRDRVYCQRCGVLVEESIPADRLHPQAREGEDPLAWARAQAAQLGLELPRDNPLTRSGQP